MGLFKGDTKSLHYSSCYPLGGYEPQCRHEGLAKQRAHDFEKTRTVILHVYLYIYIYMPMMAYMHTHMHVYVNVYTYMYMYG